MWSRTSPGCSSTKWAWGHLSPPCLYPHPGSPCVTGPIQSAQLLLLLLLRGRLRIVLFSLSLFSPVPVADLYPFACTWHSGPSLSSLLLTPAVLPDPTADRCPFIVSCSISCASVKTPFTILWPYLISTMYSNASFTYSSWSMQSKVLPPTWTPKDLTLYLSHSTSCYLIKVLVGHILCIRHTHRPFIYMFI